MAAAAPATQGPAEDAAPQQAPKQASGNLDIVAAAAVDIAAAAAAAVDERREVERLLLELAASNAALATCQRELRKAKEEIYYAKEMLREEQADSMVLAATLRKDQRELKMATFRLGEEQRRRADCAQELKRTADESARLREHLHRERAAAAGCHSVPALAAKPSLDAAGGSDASGASGKEDEAAARRKLAAAAKELAAAEAAEDEGVVARLADEQQHQLHLLRMAKDSVASAKRTAALEAQLSTAQASTRKHRTRCAAKTAEARRLQRDLASAKAASTGGTLLRWRQCVVLQQPQKQEEAKEEAEEAKGPEGCTAEQPLLGMLPWWQRRAVLATSGRDGIMLVPQPSVERPLIPASGDAKGAPLPRGAAATVTAAACGTAPTKVLAGAAAGRRGAAGQLVHRCNAGASQRIALGARRRIADVGGNVDIAWGSLAAGGERGQADCEVVVMVGASGAAASGRSKGPCPRRTGWMECCC